MRPAFMRSHVGRDIVYLDIWGPFNDYVYCLVLLDWCQRIRDVM